MRDAWLIIGITISFFLLIEIVLSIAFHYRDAEKKAIKQGEYRASADTYQNADWPKKFYEEYLESNKNRWLSYVGWRRKPYQGQFINIDSNGCRKTWSSNFGREDKGIRPTIFFFGGSTMWGTGARDDFTIPSIIAKRLAKNGINTQIINFGGVGFLSTQGVILLIRELQKGNIPDLVIFYDGVNDTYTAYQQQIAGHPQNESDRPRRRTATDLLLSLANNLSIERFIFSTKRFIKGVFSERPPVLNRRNEEALANDVLNIYEKNIEIVKSLAEHYSFKALFYWQPTIFEKKHLTKYEEKEKRRGLDMQPFYDMTYGLLRRRDFTKNGETGFHDLSMLLSDLPEPLFVDWCHLGETGNDYIAEKLIIDAISIMAGRLSVEQGAAPDRFPAPLQSGM